MSVIAPPAERMVAGIARFGRTLRAAGLEVGPGRIQDALVALTAVELSSRQQVYWALRCTLLSRHGDIEAFDEVFAQFFDRHRAEEIGRPGGPPPHPLEAESTATAGPSTTSRQETISEAQAEAEDGGEANGGMRWSAVERLRELDFASYGDDELRRAARLVERIAAAAPLRRSRRLRPAGEGRAFDKRRTLRAAMRTDGYPMVCLWRQPRLVPRRLLFVVDVSGSMEPYARAMMMFLQAAVRRGRKVEAFTLGTRLTRVTCELEGRNPDRALKAASRVVSDWAGGTRIGANLKTLNDGWGRLGVTRGAVVVIVSDGWERGDIPALEYEMQRLRRSAHTIVWVNPLAAEPGYEPLAQGMAAALPYVDHFLPGHNLRSLETLAEVLEALPGTRPRDRPRQLPR
jgi:uncharacterized protein with von Willebrand factor type A (vWA) domain